MAEGVSHSVIAKQTITQENSLLILLKLSLILCCAYKNFGFVLHKLLRRQKGMQVKIFSLSPGSDIRCTTCIFEKPKQQECAFGNMVTFFTLRGFRSVKATCRYSARGIDRVHMFDRLHLVCPHPPTYTLL